MKRSAKSDLNAGNRQQKRHRQAGTVKFSDEPEVRVFENYQDGVKDSESGDLVGAKIVGEKITGVEGEEDEGTWSDDEKQDIAIEPFNLKQEQEEGYFDVTGHYVENKFSKGVSDAWLDEYDEKWAKQMRGKNEVDKNKQSNEEEQTKIDIVALKNKLITFLKEGENVLGALRRYSGKGTIKSERDMAKFNELTEFADTLLSEGCGNIYTDSRESLMREDELAHVQTQNQTIVTDQDSVFWEYKLKDGTTFGPYTTRDMAAWSQQGYFSAESGALVRQVKNAEENIFEEEENDFVPSHTIDFTTFSQ